MSFSYFIGFFFLACIVIIGTIATLGWMHESKKRESLEKELKRAEKELELRKKEIDSLNSWLSIYKAQGGIDFDVER